MLSQQFIFSEKRSDRIKRHILFWIIWALYLAVLQANSPFLKPTSSYWSNLPFSIARSFLLLVPQLVTTYMIIYLVVPLYIKKRQLLLALFGVVAIFMINASINIQMARTINPRVLGWLLPANYYRYMDPPPQLGFFLGLLAATKGVFTSAGIVVLLKYVKQRYIKEQRNLQLQKENAESQLQLLTSQVHPNFLFNTLTNIYTQTKTESPKGSSMIMQLSDMLRYILAEGGSPLVPLHKELIMIQDYINLEKVRYGNKLRLHLSFPPETGNLQIAPLLLLPFVENCFKHGASQFLSSPWINLRIETRERELQMKLMNGKDPDHQEDQPKSGIGINNVKKRLELLYPGKYDLQITDEPEVFIVSLRLKLADGRQAPQARSEKQVTSTNIAAGYA